MKRHELDVVSLVFGLVFLGTAVIWGFSDAPGPPLDGWPLPVLLIAVGLAGEIDPAVLAAHGIEVKRLIRIAIGRLPLGDLAKGAWRLLEPAEIAWVNAYHADVWRDISARVDDETRSWLEAATAKL